MADNVRIPSKKGRKSCYRTHRGSDDYLQSRHIRELFELLTATLVVAAPEDPVQFLVGLLREMIRFRKGKSADAPLLLADHHLAAVFSSYDPAGAGYVTAPQFHDAMKTLGVAGQGSAPVAEEDGRVQKDEFIRTAKDRLLQKLLQCLMPTE
ncbi:uncharacterized protein LOC134537189 [Bacillus rossius redtenbacheri]|uniref:uncharacterized protein LOC134537189 n=1 Tax=Bacillus rossius redtenbacheri TaxID=93214 RepID=UPI002FDEDABE